MGTVLLYGLIGLAVLLVLWPTRSVAARFLRRWGVEDPTEEQGSHALRYLRDRRLLYLLVFLLAAPVATAVAGLLDLPTPETSGFRDLLAPGIVALLIGEVIAALRPVRGLRVAALSRRRWRDLVPRWAMSLFSALTALAVLFASAALSAQPWALTTVSAERFTDHFRAEIARPVGVVVLVGAALGLMAVLGVVRLAVRRGSVADPEVDAVLRMRSARVAVGIGMAWMAWMVTIANGRLSSLYSLSNPSGSGPGWMGVVPVIDSGGLFVLLAAVVGWIWVANPPRRTPANAVEAGR
ncbi:hypothetical protein FHS29_000978 [Saccharothrix tamanrassetensis]|uniref:Uncharacterized protein n=1 Tax=Saccharothrix tamanrassetensis TaxID=1051531 RepID=A0A841CE16_9PSEU|nr:hypothetical protein [Saccharothrix tamanrassetensis]MBB5954408.1 hypothetical protein [Saccharothrix tamanrassetensis]